MTDEEKKAIERLNIYKEKMLDILKSNLPLEYQNFWYDIGVKIQKYINGVVQVFFDTSSLYIVIKVFIEKFNYSMYFNFPYDTYKYDYKNLVEHILNGIQLKLYKEVFKKGE